MEFRNAKFVEFLTGNQRWVDCEINHPELGWIETTISPDEDAEFYDLVAAEAPLYTPPDPADVLAAAKTAAEVQVDQEVGNLRLEYITDIPGQEMIYQAKEAEALAFKAIDPVPTDLTMYPYISGEAAALNVSATEVADQYIALSIQWRAVGAQLEALRIGYKAAIQVSTTTAQVDVALTAFEAAVAALNA